LYILLTYLTILSYYDIPITEIRKLINAIDKKQTVFNYLPPISEKLKNLVVIDNDVDNKLEEKIEQIKKELTQQNDELKKQMESIMELLKAK
jgi:DNA-binding transcriptional MerR regulator